MRYRALTAVGIAALSLIGATLLPTAASAATTERDTSRPAAAGAAPQAPGPVVINTEVVDVRSYANSPQYSDRLTYCQAVTEGQTCTISQSFSVTRSIGVDLGMSRGAVAAGLSISASDTNALSVSCTSPPLAAGQIYEAYPSGTRYYYRIKKWGTMTPETYSGTLTAFDPQGIACRVA